MSEPLVVARGLTRRYGTHDALVGFDLDCAGGEVVALLGTNGSGKTTALRCMAGQLVPTAGWITAAGADPHREPEGEAARRALAFVPDAPVFYRELTVAEHVRLVAAAFDDPSGVERGEAVLGELDVFERAGARPHELSSGQRQKALLACVAARPFTVLLLDEPVLRLDPGSQAWLHRWLVDQRQAGTAIVVTTHQPAFIEGLADRVVQLHEGSTVADEDLAAFRARGDGTHIGAHGAADPTAGAITPAEDDADAP